MNPRHLLFLFLGALTVFRLIYCTQLELSPDETYYFQWSQHLDISYYSKGPGVALAMWFGTLIGGDNAFGIRFLSPLLSLGTSLLMFGFARRLYGEVAAIWTVFAIQFVPIFQVGGLVLTIDPISIFFWMAALYTFWLALEKSPGFNLWWPATGALIGCGFLAKYTNAMQLLSILLVLLLTSRYRRELWHAGFLSLLGVFSLFTIPVLVWNSQHAWITFIHLRDRGGLDSGPKFNPSEFLTYFGLHLGVYSPLIFLGLLACIVWAWKKAAAHFKPRFLLAFTLPLFVLYFALALKQTGEPNWTAPAAISLVVLAVPFWLELAQEKKWARIYVVAALALGGLMSVITINMDVLRVLGLPLSYEDDPSARLRGWKTTAAQVQKVREQYEAKIGQPVFLIADKYSTAASLGYYLPDPRREGAGHPPVYVPESAWPGNQFYFWPRYDGMVDFADVAREKLRPSSNLTPELRTELTASLEALPPESPAGEMRHAEDFKTIEQYEAYLRQEAEAEATKVAAKQRFLEALKAAAPELNIESYFTETLGYNPFLGRSALYITDRDESKPASVIGRTFAKTEMIACFDVVRRGHRIRQVRVFACSDYRMLEL
jgi:4-amino-4-deoxy-L-arabinose transferase-like glycosyltransferase